MLDNFNVQEESRNKKIASLFIRKERNLRQVNVKVYTKTRANIDSLVCNSSFSHNKLTLSYYNKIFVLSVAQQGPTQNYLFFFFLLHIL